MKIILILVFTFYSVFHITAQGQEESLFIRRIDNYLNDQILSTNPNKDIMVYFTGFSGMFIEGTGSSKVAHFFSAEQISTEEEYAFTIEGTEVLDNSVINNAFANLEFNNSIPRYISNNYENFCVESTIYFALYLNGSKEKEFHLPAGLLCNDSGEVINYPIRGELLFEFHEIYLQWISNPVTTLNSEFTNDREGWIASGASPIELSNGRLKSTVDKRWEGVIRPLNEFTVAPGDTFKVTGVFDKGNTVAAINLYFQELDANGNHLSWNVMNSNLQTGDFSHQHTVRAGNKLVLRIDKTNTHENDTTSFYLDEITITKE